MPSSKVSVKEKPEPILRRQCEVMRTSVPHLFACPEIADLLREYAEQANELLAAPAPQMDSYIKMEEAGYLHAIGAFIDGKLVGFAGLIVAVLPHYGHLSASMESLFVGKAHRKSGAGLKLIKEAESMARDLGATSFAMTVPAHGKLSSIMPRVGYRKTNEVFLKVL